MKSRTETETREIRRVVMLQAADLIEREGRYQFFACDVPRACDDVGCVLGWIAYAAGIPDDEDLECRQKGLLGAATFLGFNTQMDMYGAMSAAQYRRYPESQLWQHDATVAANTLRKLAGEI